MDKEKGKELFSNRSTFNQTSIHKLGQPIKMPIVHENQRAKGNSQCPPCKFFLQKNHELLHLVVVWVPRECPCGNVFMGQFTPLHWPCYSDFSRGVYTVSHCMGMIYYWPTVQDIIVRYLLYLSKRKGERLNQCLAWQWAVNTGSCCVWIWK